jgi:hypothetical protein
MRVLIAFPARELELAEALCEELDDRAHLSITIENVTTEKQAQRAIGGSDFAVIVVHEQLPRAARDAPNPTGGLDFIARLRANNITTRAALLHSRTSFTPAEFQQLTELKDVTLIAHNEDVITQLVDYVLSSKGPKPRLDITLDLTQSPEKYRISGENYLRTPLEGFLCLKAHDVRTLKVLSKDIDGDALALLRDNLWDRLVEGQTQFSKQLAAAMEKSGPIENTRLRFRIARENYEVAFEAIRHPKTPSDYWMLGAPVYRTLGFGVETQAKPLFQSGERQGLNCLVVLADASGSVEYQDQIERHYKPIKRGRLECERLCDILSKARDDKVNIDNIEFVGKESPVTLQSLRTLLSPDEFNPTRRWDLIHFVGHTDFINDVGYFVMPRSGSGVAAEAVPAKELTPLLSNSRLLYLSSCDSASAAFVFRLAERGISSLLGFCMPIADSLAVEHATEFYGHLFRTRSTEEAFLATRRHFYQMHPESRVWARAMLILQA